MIWRSHVLHKETRLNGLQQLSELKLWTRRRFKQKKNRSMSLWAGRLRQIYFRIAGEKIPAICDAPVRSVGKWFTDGMTGIQRGIEIQQLAVDGIRVIYRSMLPEWFRLWWCQFCFLPRLLRTLTDVARHAHSSMLRSFDEINCWGVPTC